MYFPQFHTIGLPEIYTILASIGLVVIAIHYFRNFGVFSFYKKDHMEENSEDKPISVIICARNEDENLTEFLPKVLTQNYPNFEVIVVNDCSYDNTDTVIEEFSKIFPNLKKATIKEDDYYKHGKKFAMLVGIKKASHDNLVFTDADCFPASENWLAEMAKGFTPSKKVILGYGAYQKQAGFLNKLIRYDSFIIAVQYLSAAIKNKPYMGVGRNLAYSKELFFQMKGFSTHYHINSGDDDLFVNTAATKSNTNISANINSITYSKPKSRFKEWSLQKARHLTTAPHYTTESKSRLFYIFFAQYFFYISLIPLLFQINTLVTFGIIFFIKTILFLICLNKASKKLGESDLLIRGIILELLMLFIYPIFQLAKLRYKPAKWTN
ncbi:MAG: glycosyltransferase [Bacteroidota bacterium]|jgi:glycosyltransferase involved in cell wall biosynthesis